MSDKRETIDILMATYNGEKYLREQIDSILNQTYKDFRLLISDDCSTDGTRDIIKEYAEKDKRIIPYFQENNLGYIKNFEFLLYKVENDIYALSDQDDVWNEDKIEKEYYKLIDSHADLVFTDLQVVDEELNEICPSFNDYMLLSRKIKYYNHVYIMEYLYNCVTGCTLMSKKKFLDKVLPLPYESKHVVHDMWIAEIVSLYGKLDYIKEPTIKYRQHGTNSIGIDKVSHHFKKLSEVRNHFIDVKIGIFKTYVENNDRFPKELRTANKEALEYYKMLKTKKYLNFKKWKTFRSLYRYETFKYRIQNFAILNLPLLCIIPFKIRYGILKLRGKR